VILYLDSSSLVKLYVDEIHSLAVREWAEEAEIVATCRVAYPETISALNRRFRTGDMSKRTYAFLTKVFADEWPRFAAVNFDEIAAGGLAAKHGLKGFDAIHLSAAISLRSGENAGSLAFSSFDEKLNAAAASERLPVLLPD
jgi:predicted nucleic acid-binding protein